MIEHEGDQWKGGWDVHGIRVNDGRTVAIRIGVISYGGEVWVALGGSESPVALSNTTATDVAELFRWALDERELVAERHRQRETDALKVGLDRAILTRRQWRRIREALEAQDTKAPSADAALTALSDGAPPGWTGERPTQAP